MRTHASLRMKEDAAELVLALLGVTTAVLLVVWGVLTYETGAAVDLLFWILAAAFVVYIVWDTRRHLKAIRARKRADEGKKS